MVTRQQQLIAGEADKGVGEADKGGGEIGRTAPDSTKAGSKRVVERRCSYHKGTRAGDTKGEVRRTVMTEKVRQVNTEPTPPGGARDPQVAQDPLETGTTRFCQKRDGINGESQLTQRLPRQHHGRKGESCLF